MKTIFADFVRGKLRDSGWVSEAQIKAVRFYLTEVLQVQFSEILVDFDNKIVNIHPIDKEGKPIRIKVKDQVLFEMRDFSGLNEQYEIRFALPNERNTNTDSQEPV